MTTPPTVSDPYTPAPATPTLASPPPVGSMIKATFEWHDERGWTDLETPTSDFLRKTWAVTEGDVVIRVKTVGTSSKTFAPEVQLNTLEIQNVVPKNPVYGFPAFFYYLQDTTQTPSLQRPPEEAPATPKMEPAPMAEYPGELIPATLAWHDERGWTDQESPDSDQMRRTWSVNAGETTYRVQAYRTVAKTFATETQLRTEEIHSVVTKDPPYGFAAVFYYRVPSPT